MGDAGLALLAERLPSLPELQMLSLTSCAIGERGAAALLAVAGKCSALTNLVLSSNPSKHGVERSNGIPRELRPAFNSACRRGATIFW